MPTIRDIGGSSTFGQDFNYAVWTANTEIMLCNVPWNMDYRDIVYFDTVTHLDSYLESETYSTPVVIEFTGLTYARPGTPIRISAPFGSVYNYNYIRVRNPAQPVTGDQPRSFYYFITDIRYVAGNTTEIQVQLDVWQTFGRHVTFGNCYVERGHIGIAASNSFDDHGRTFLTIPEGLDVGSEYVTAKTYTHNIAGPSAMVGESSIPIGLIIASTVSLVPPYGTVDAPILSAATGSSAEGLPNGCELYYVQNVDDYQNLMGALSSTPWISQGIVSVTAIPPISISGLDSPITVTAGVWTADIYKLTYSAGATLDGVTLRTSFRDDVTLGRYANLKKFLVSPYTMVEVTTYSGTPLILKPESIPSDDLEMVELRHVVPPNPRIVFYPLQYNCPKGADLGDVNGIYAGEFMDMMTGLFDLPTFSVINSGVMSYLAANKNNIAYMHSSADWSQQRALSGASLSFDQANLGVGLQNKSTDISTYATARNAAVSQTAAMQHAGLNAVAGVMRGAAGGTAGVGMGVAGAVQDGLSTAIQVNQIGAAADVSINQQTAQNRVNVDNAYLMRDTNYAYAQFAAKGDYANNIAAINAKVQDAKLIQPTTSGQVGGDAFTLASMGWRLYGKLKILQAAPMAAIGEFWLRYGYAINRFTQMPSNYQVMDKFTYWKLRETYIISSSCPETFKQTLRGIFEKGVTVWSSPSDIGNIDIATNTPLTGITL